MAVEIVDVGPCKKVFKVRISKERVADELKKSYQQVQKTVTLRGFRRGHVPITILEKRYGKDIERELETNLAQTTLAEALEEADLKVLGEPKIANQTFDKSGDPALTYEATIQVRPEFAVPDLAGIRVLKPKVEVSEETMTKALEAFRRSRAKVGAKGDGFKIAAGDIAILEVARKDAPEGEKAELGRMFVELAEEKVGRYEVKGLAAALTGKGKDAVVEVDGKLGDATHKLKLTVADARTYELPALDDEFAKTFDCADMKELREMLKGRLTADADRAAMSTVDDRILDTLLARVEFPVPDELVDQELDELALRAMVKAHQEGADEEEAARAGGRIREGSRADVVRTLKGVLLLDKIAEQKRVFATEAEVAKAVTEIAARRRTPVTELIDELERSGGLGRLRANLKLEKTKTMLRGLAEVVDEENR